MTTHSPDAAAARRMNATLLGHFEQRLAGLDDGDYLGPLLEIVDAVAVLHDHGRLAVAPDLEPAARCVAASARQAAELSAGIADRTKLLAAPGWSSAGATLAHCLGYLTATAPCRVSPAIDGLLAAVPADSQVMRTYLTAARARVDLYVSPTPELLASLFPLACELREAHLEYSWNFLFEALPTAFQRGGRDFVQQMLADVPAFITADLPPIGAFRIWNVLALGAMQAGDVDGAERYLDSAASSLHDPRVASRTRAHYLALVESNRARVLLDTTRLGDADAAIRRALTVAEPAADRIAAVWQHAERGCRIAVRLGEVPSWHEFMAASVPLFPAALEGDSYYCARKYFRLVTHWLEPLAAAGMATEAARLAAHSLPLLDRYTPAWNRERAVLEGAMRGGGTRLAPELGR